MAVSSLTTFIVEGVLPLHAVPTWKCTAMRLCSAHWRRTDRRGRTASRQAYAYPLSEATIMVSSCVPESV